MIDDRVHPDSLDSPLEIAARAKITKHQAAYSNINSVFGNIFWDFLTIFFFCDAPRSGRRRLAPQAKFLGDVT